VADAYQAIADQVERRLGELGFQATTRVKTTGTLVDKLRRDSTLKLRSVHDLSGARIVIDGNLNDQDAAKTRVVEEFASCPRPPVVKDRRETPSHGYRAVHVIAFPENMPIEIQIRTALQNIWAQYTESLGDRWGRGLRYGTGPDDPDSPAGEPYVPGLTRAQVVEVWARVSELFYDFEQMELELIAAEKQIGAGTLTAEAMADLRSRGRQNRDAIRTNLGMLGLASTNE
jgi:Region found in RelA / SpoT proteins